MRREFLFATALFSSTPTISRAETFDLSSVEATPNQTLPPKNIQGPDKPSLTPTTENPLSLKENLSPEIIEGLKRFPQFGLKPGELAIIVIPNEQRLAVFKDGKEIASFDVSTSRKGVGIATKDSNKTPIGMHKVRYKRGEGAKIGKEFGTRGVRGMITRKLALDGLEPGINKGGKFDSSERGIAIHGTPSIKKLGNPASHGCIRMDSYDVIKLFNQISEGTLVLILPDTVHDYTPKPHKHTRK